MLLKSDFSLNKYGLITRLVDESDAEFIVSLRSDPERTKYMITLESDIEKQREWIRVYKVREREGIDYYFLYLDTFNNPEGVNRLSHINLKDRTCRFSSWIKRKGSSVKAIVMFHIRNEIVFELLDMNYAFGEIHKKNKSALKYWELIDIKIIEELDQYYLFVAEKSSYINNRQKIIDIINNKRIK